MKKVLLLIIVMISVSTVYGQKKRKGKKRTPKKVEEKAEMMDDDGEEYAKTEYEKYRAITLGFGSRFIATDPGTLVTSFTDNSPAPDDLMTTTEVDDGYMGIGISIGYKFGRYSGLSHDIDLDLTLGSAGSGLMATYGLGWNFPMDIGDKELLIRPSIYGGFGGFGFEVGEMENNTGFIQIGETQYNEQALDVALQSSVLVYGPAVDFVYRVLDRVDVFLSAHYDIGSSNKDGEIIFSSQVEDSKESRLKLNGENPKVIYNGEETTTLPYDISGIRIQIGASYLWNRD